MKQRYLLPLILWSTYFLQHFVPQNARKHIFDNLTILISYGAEPGRGVGIPSEPP